MTLFKNVLLLQLDQSLFLPTLTEYLLSMLPRYQPNVSVVQVGDCGFYGLSVLISLVSSAGFTWSSGFTF